MNRYSSYISSLTEAFENADLAVRAAKGSYTGVTIDAKGNVTSDGKRILELPNTGDKYGSGSGEVDIQASTGTHMGVKVVSAGKSTVKGNQYKVVDSGGKTLVTFSVQ